MDLRKWKAAAADVVNGLENHLKSQPTAFKEGCKKKDTQFTATIPTEVRA